MKKILIFAMTICALKSHAQVGINTTTPNKATALEISSNDKGILIPRLTEVERNTKLADNDPDTIPPAGVVNPNLTAGTLIFNSTANAFQYWDGLLWRQLFVATSTQAGNDGVVKIISGGSQSLKPNFSLGASGNSYGPEKQVVYTTPLNFAPSPTTSWPETVPGYDDPLTDKTAYIYDSSNNKFRENKVNGQVHLWRLIVLAQAGSGSGGSLKATLRNPDSNFIVNSIGLVPAGSNGPGNIVTFYFYTIADPDSLADHKGYQLFMASDITVNVTVDSFTRVSLFKD